jgi:hypothetical protein
MSNSRIAALLLSIIALLVTGLMVETYWDCRLRGHSMKECLSQGAAKNPDLDIRWGTPNKLRPPN